MYTLGAKSLLKLQGVKPQLVAVVKRAIVLTSQDFSVHDGLRTEAEQRELVRKGASQTMLSKHRTGDAVDLVPYINGQLRWEWEPIYNIARAVRQAAVELNVQIRWGGSWSNLTMSTEPPEKMLRDYTDRKIRAGEKAFQDGPHYELM